MATVRKRRTHQPLEVADYGPGLRRNRDGRWVDVGAARSVLENREDISVAPNRSGNRPLTRGARRWDALVALLAKDVISRQQFQAGQKFLDTLSRATGGGGKASFLFSAIRSQPGLPSFGIDESQRRALLAVEKVMTVIGVTTDSVLWHVLVNNGTCCEFARAHKMRASRPCEMLRDELDALDEFCYSNGSIG